VIKELSHGIFNPGSQGVKEMDFPGPTLGWSQRACIKVPLGGITHLTALSERDGR